MKLALGTVQFGLDYGVSNASGQVVFDEATAIVELAERYGITTLDTAAAYGSSEKVLGNIGVSGFDLVCKFANLDQSLDLEGEFKNSLKTLGLSSIYGYLIHDAKLLFSQEADEVYRKLVALKEMGHLEKIGVSVYTPDELTSLLERFDFDLVQLPFNVIDGRWEKSGVLELLQKQKIEVHVRSVFLQGLLLMPLEAVPASCAKAIPTLQTWHAWCRDCNVTPVEACIAALRGKDWISQLVLGVTSVEQLDQAAAASTLVLENLDTIPQIEDEDVLNPARWQA